MATLWPVTENSPTLPEPDQRALADAQRLSGTLSRLERDARKLRWHAERPWAASSHVWAEGPLLVVDLHDLSVKLAKRAVEKAWKLDLQSGAVCFITGVGNNSIDGTSRLMPAVQGMLASACEKNDDWSYRSGGPGRIVLITDPSRAPEEAQTSLPRGFWLLVALIAAAIAFAFLWDTFA